MKKEIKEYLENLKEKRVLQGFKRMLNLNKLGITRYRLFLKLHNMTEESDIQITEYMLKTKEIIIHYEQLMTDNSIILRKPSI